MNSLAAKKDSHSRGPKDTVQTKLRINEPGDRFEQEADAMADQVMGMRRFEHSYNQDQSMIGRSIQRKCAECESSGTQCSECAAKEKKKKSEVFRKEVSAGPFNTSNQFDAVLHSMMGMGQPLGETARNEMETAFSADFSEVRIHSGQESDRLNKEINARAFTVGNDVFFANGQFNIESEEGKRLLAHELTHVIQQGNQGTHQIQRQEEGEQNEGGGSADIDTKQDQKPDSDFDPTTVIGDYLAKIHDEREKPAQQEEAENQDDNGDEKKDAGVADPAWITNDPLGDRKLLLLNTEFLRLNEKGVVPQIISKYAFTQPDGATNYLTDVKAQIDKIAPDEKTTLSFINQQLSMGCNETNFIDLDFFQHENAANAFPDLTWNIVYPLIAPPPGMDTAVPENFQQSLKNYYARGSDLTTEMFYEGLPVSYQKSLSLESYELVKRKAGAKMNDLPNEEWVINNYVAPEEFELHTERFKSYDTSLGYYVQSSFYQFVYNLWKEVSAGRWLRFNTLAISKFRKDYSGGLMYLDNFFKFEYKGLGSSLGIFGQAVLSLTPVGGLDPYMELGKKSEEARNKTPQQLDNLNQEAYKLFLNYLSQDDDRVSNLSANERLSNAVFWSIEKGFAGESIRIMLDNLDEILLKVLEEWAEQKGIKYAITTAVGWLGGPWGRLISFVYNAYTKYNDLKGAVELGLLVNSLVDIIKDARNAKTIVQAQRSAAKLAEAYETIFVMIIQHVGNKVLDKLSDKAVKAYKKRKATEEAGNVTEAKRNKLLDDSHNENNVENLSDEELNAEVVTANKSKARKLPEGDDFDAEIDLPNNHHWKRKKTGKKDGGTWCRSTDECQIPTKLTKKEKEELDQKADEVAPRRKRQEPSETEGEGPELLVDPKELPYGMHIIDPLVKKPPKPKRIPLKDQPAPPPYYSAEKDLLKALNAKFPEEKWEPQETYKPKKAGKTEKLGSTRPEAVSNTNKKKPKVFEAKRLNLEGMGLDAEGKRIGPPSPETIEAMTRARGQYDTRKQLIKRGIQNLVFNVTGQTKNLKTAADVGESIKQILAENHVNYDVLWVQFKDTLIQID